MKYLISCGLSFLHAFLRAFSLRILHRFQEKLIKFRMVKLREILVWVQQQLNVTWSSIWWVGKMLSKVITEFSCSFKAIIYKTKVFMVCCRLLSLIFSLKKIILRLFKSIRTNFSRTILYKFIEMKFWICNP